VPRRLRDNWCLFLLIMALFGGANAAFPQTPSEALTMQQCEPDSCGTWSFHGNQGVGKWLTGPAADLTIEHFDSQSVSIRREDTGGTKGLKGRYTGTRKGGHIEGTFTWTWPGGAFPSGTVNWIATIEGANTEAMLPAPGALAMCEDAADGCSNWSFQGHDGYGNWSNCASANLSVEHFDGRTITIRRIDATGAWQGLSALYTGTVVGDRIDGAMSWLWQGHDPFTIGTVAWHATIGTAPAEHAVQVDTAMLCASSASIAHNYRMASHWFMYAERQGNVRASVNIGILLVNGPEGIPRDYANALKRFQFAGSKGDTLGMNNAALIYQRGLGVAVNPERVKYWGDRLSKRREQFYPVCSSNAVWEVMEKLLEDSRNNPGSVFASMLEHLAAESMQVELQHPQIRVAAGRTTDVISDDDFKCDAVFASQKAIEEQTKQNCNEAQDEAGADTASAASKRNCDVIRARNEADADTAIAAFLANAIMKNVQPIQEYHLKRTGPGEYIVSLEAVGSDNAQGGMRMPLPKPYSRPVSIR
jgi:hypothetical protein